jgi:hypothetical protein
MAGVDSNSAWMDLMEGTGFNYRLEGIFGRDSELY